MKSRIILFAIGASALLLSCSDDRDGQVPSAESVKTDLKLKPISGNSTSKTDSENFVIEKDSLRFEPPASATSGIGDPPVVTPGEDGGDPKDVPVPPRR